MAKRVDQHGTQHDRIADEQEDVREIERDPTRRTAGDDGIRDALCPHERRDQVAERTADREGRAEQRAARSEPGHDRDESDDDKRRDEHDERRTEMVIGRVCRRLVREVDARERDGDQKQDEPTRHAVHCSVATQESVRRATNDVRVARRRYPDCVSRMGTPRVRSLEDLVVLPQRSPLTEELSLALGAAARLHMLKSDLLPVPVRVTATTSEAGAYRYRRATPIDLRVSNRSGHAATGFLHELAHLVDHQVHYDRQSRVWASSVHPAFTGWRAAAARLEGRPFPGGSHRRRYFQSAQEVWARCYAQTVLLRSGDSFLLDQLERLQRIDEPHVWPAKEFEPVAVQVELVFVRLGLTQLELPIAA
jgi:hypothetical protein